MPSHPAPYQSPPMTSSQLAYAPPPNMQANPAAYMAGCYPPQAVMYPNQHPMQNVHPHPNMPPSQWGTPMPPQFDSPTPSPQPALHQQQHYIPAPTASRLTPSSPADRPVASPVAMTSSASPMRDHPVSSPRLRDGMSQDGRHPVSPLVNQPTDFEPIHDTSQSPEPFKHQTSTQAQPTLVDAPGQATGARQVTNDGFFIAFDNEAPLKPRPKLGRTRPADPSPSTKPPQVVTSPENQGGSRTSPVKAPQQTHSPHSASSAHAGHVADVTSESHFNDSLPSEAFVVGDFDDVDVSSDAI